MILLDTHVLIWWMQGDRERIGKAGELLDTLAPGEVGISVVSLWEIASLSNRQRLQFSFALDDWICRLQAVPQILILPLSLEVAVSAPGLPELAHRDPADRFLIAEARFRDCLLVTEDKIILAYGGVRAVRCNQLATAISGQ